MLINLLAAMCISINLIGCNTKSVKSNLIKNKKQESNSPEKEVKKCKCYTETVDGKHKRKIDLSKLVLKTLNNHGAIAKLKVVKIGNN